MAWPTSPSAVGLTVAKSTLDLIDTLTTYSTTQTVTGKRFRKTVTVTGGTVTFRDCWFYGPGFWSVRLNGGNAILEDFEIGIGPLDVTAQDPSGWVYADHLVEVSLFAGVGWFHASSGYLHHGGDLVRIGPDSTLENCYLADQTTESADHADAIQCLGGTGFVIRDNYISAIPSVLLAETGATAILLKSDTGDIAGTVDGNFIDADAFWAMQVRDGAGGAFPSGVVFTNNRFGRTASSGPFTTGGDGSLSTRYGNRFLDDLTLIPGDAEEPSVAGAFSSAYSSAFDIASGADLTASASLAGTGTLTANAVVTRFASAALAGSGTLTVDAQRTTFGAAALSGTGALTADAQRTAIAAVSLSGAGTLTASAQRTTFASVALAGVGTLLAGSQSAPVALVPPRPSVRPGRLARLLNQGVLVINRSQTGPPDEYGTPTWVESEFVTECHVQPLTAEEMFTRPADRVRYRAWFPAGTAIGAPDRIVLASGLEAEVVGSALAWFNPRRRTESHLVVELADVSDEATGGS